MSRRKPQARLQAFENLTIDLRDLLAKLRNLALRIRHHAAQAGGDAALSPLAPPPFPESPFVGVAGLGVAGLGVAGLGVTGLGVTGRGLGLRRAALCRLGRGAGALAARFFRGRFRALLGRTRTVPVCVPAAAFEDEADTARNLPLGGLACRSSGTSLSGAALIDCSSSQACWHSAQRYSYVILRKPWQVLVLTKTLDIGSVPQVWP